MNVRDYIKHSQSNLFPITLFRKYDGLNKTKTVIPNDINVVLLNNIGTSKALPFKIETDSLELINDRPEKVYMEQVVSAVKHALTSKYKQEYFEISYKDLTVFVHFTHLTKTSKELFEADEVTIEISADPQDPLKLTVNNGSYVNKSMAYFLALQLNAYLKRYNPKTGKYVSLRLSSK